jgi:hypothetical protein
MANPAKEPVILNSRLFSQRLSTGQGCDAQSEAEAEEGELHCQTTMVGEDVEDLADDVELPNGETDKEIIV